MVSRGRSIRGRVGFDRSGSAIHVSVRHSSTASGLSTDDVSIRIPVLEPSNGFQCGIIKNRLRSCQSISLQLSTLDEQNVHGCASLIALEGSAFVLILYRAFSCAVSAASIFGSEPLLLLRLLPVKLNMDLVRGRAISRTDVNEPDRYADVDEES